MVQFEIVHTVLWTESASNVINTQKCDSNTQKLYQISQLDNKGIILASYYINYALNQVEDNHL